MSKKKLIFSLVVTSFSIVFCGTVNFANASSVVEVCRLDAKIINVTEGHVFVDIAGIKIYNKSSVLCADINKNSDYKIIRDNFLKNSYRESIFVGQNIIIDGVSGNAMGPDGPVYWDSWELESAGGKAIKLPITLERVNINVTVGNTDSLIEGQTYTVAELNTNTSITPRKFFTEAYVVMNSDAVRDYDGKLKINFLRPYFKTAHAEAQHPASVRIIVISDKSGDETEEIKAGRKLYGHEIQFEVSPEMFKDLKVNQIYRFELLVGKFANADKNNISIVSAKNLDGTALIAPTSTSPVTQPPTKQSFFARIWNWFAGLFKR